jgi:uncharacterized phage protein (TIGR02220 family)
MSKIKTQTANYIKSLSGDEKDAAITMLASSKRDQTTLQGWNLAYGLSISRLESIMNTIDGLESGNSIPEEYAVEVAEILTLLTELTGVQYKMKSKAASLIVARLNDNYTVLALKAIVQHKYDDWKNTDFIRYVRPDTLFRRSNCERYIQEIQSQLKKQQHGTRIGQITGVVERAKAGL